jgi:hypothetical protein
MKNNRNFLIHKEVTLNRPIGLCADPVLSLAFFRLNIFFPTFQENLQAQEW